MAIRVLIIDPDIPFMVRIKQALDETNEFNVSISANGLAAEDALRHHPHDIAVLDFSIPDVDTAALLAQLRHTQSGLAAIVCPEDEAQYAYAEDLTVQGILPKPYTARELIGLIREIVPASPRDAVEDEEDDFIPPEMPPNLRHLLKPDESPGLSPTELLDEVEQDRFEAEAEAEVLEPLGTSELVAEPEQLDILADLEAIENSFPEPEITWDYEEDYEEVSGTMLLDRQDRVDPGGTALLEPDEELDPTVSLAETETLDDLILEHGWSPAPGRSADPSQFDFGIEPPIHPEDTPTVSDREIDEIRQYLAAEREHASTEFNEVLDAMADAPPETTDLSQRDREFHDLVESMRTPSAAPSGRSSLEDLLSNIAAEEAEGDGDDGDSSSTLDYVLNAIRRGKPPAESAPGDEATGGDETIGEIIGDLFDPSFQGVLAALAGEDVAEDEDAPTAQAQTQPRQPVPQPDASLDELRAQAQAGADFDDLVLDQDDPAWLADYEAGGILPDVELPPDAAWEPDRTADDSSRYPATQALNAVSDDEPEFSLDTLLEEIEQRLPVSDAPRPRLKPLPSWKQSEVDRDASRMADLFGQAPGLEESVPPPGDDMFREPPVSKEDTQPSQAVWDELSRLVGEPVVVPRPDQPDPAPAQEVSDITPPEDIAPPPDIVPPPPDDMAWATAAQAGDGEAELDDMRASALEWEPDAAELADLFDAAAEAERAPEAEPLRDTDETAAGLAGIFEGLLDDAAQRLAPPDEAEALPTPDDDSAAALDEAFAAPEDEWSWDALETPTGEAWEPEPGAVEEEPLEAAELPEPSFAWDSIESATDDEDALPDVFFAEDMPEPAGAPAEDGSAEYVPDEVFAPDEVERYALEESEEDDATVLARVAVQLTQFALESSSQAIMLTRPGQRLAEAGELPPAAMDRLFQIIDKAWQTGEGRSASLLSYVRLPDVGEFMLHSALVEDDMVLSVVFHSDTPVRTIRRQARRLGESLAIVPEVVAFEEAEFAAPRAPVVAPPEASPEDLRLAAERALEDAAAGFTPREPVADYDAAPEEAAPDDEPIIGYTCLWLVGDPTRIELAGDLAQDLQNWIAEIASENTWDLQQIDLSQDFLMLALDIPQKVLPDDVIARLMDEIGQLAASYYPEIVDETGPLWADGYYLITPPRDLTDREIARFAAFQYPQ